MNQNKISTLGPQKPLTTFVGPNKDQIYDHLLPSVLELVEAIILKDE
jgi:hypothetical protein